MAFRALEIGAQTEEFARQFISAACVSDIGCSATLDVRCGVYPYIGRGRQPISMADRLPFTAAVFDEVWMVNPYNYGFKFMDFAVATLAAIDRVLRPGGVVTILGYHNNGWCRPANVETVTRQLGWNYVLTPIDASVLYPGHVFNDTQGRQLLNTPDRRQRLTKP